jgi:hypothetical protein
MLLPCILLTAQIKIEHVQDAPGKLIRKHNTVTFLSSFKILPAAKVSSLANAADKIMDIICQSPHLKSPVGYNAKVNITASDAGLKEKEPRLKIFCYLRYLIKDSRYTGIKESMDGVDFYLYINDFGFFHQMGNYWEDCNRLKFPLFFEAPSLTDSTNDYIEFQYKGGPVRIVMAGSKPLFLPLTRKEFVQFLIARDQYRIKDNESSISDIEKNKKQTQETLANPPSYLTNDVKKALADGILTSNKQILEIQDRIKNIKEQINRVQQYLNAMTPVEAIASVRLDYTKNNDEVGMGGIRQLVPIGRKEGKLLVRLNPAFYDHSLNAPLAQLITLYYAWPTVGFAKDPDYLQQAVLNIYNHADYHALKESLK